MYSFRRLIVHNNQNTLIMWIRKYVVKGQVRFQNIFPTGTFQWVCQRPPKIFKVKRSEK